MKTVAVIFGGKSAEHDVSTVTAHIPIIESLLASGQYDVWSVYISKEGKWYCDKRMNDLSFFQQPDYESQLGKPVDVSLNGEFVLKWPGLLSKSLTVDVVFPSMHGTYGEDGSLMGVLRMANVPFVGCDMAASAVAMDKVLTKQVLEADGLPVVPYVWFTRAQWERGADAYKKKIKELSFPLFVKPVHLGSSIAITKAKDEKELMNAIEVALHYDDKVLVEEGIQPLVELTLPLMGNDDVQPAEVERPLNNTEFFNFEDKYLSGGGKKGGGKSGGVNNAYSEIPAKIGDDMTKKVKDMGAQVYTTLGCTGVARVDFLMREDTKELFVNEVNTLPGSLYHHNWKKAGVSSLELVTKLIALAEERFAAQKDTVYAFQSDILNKVGGPKVQQ